MPALVQKKNDEEIILIELSRRKLLKLGTAYTMFAGDLHLVSVLQKAVGTTRAETSSKEGR